MKLFTRRRKVVSVTGTYSVLTSDEIVLGSDAGGSFTATLPSAASCINKVFTFHKTNSSANLFTIAPAGGDTIQGAASVALAKQYQSITLVSSGGATWQIIARHGEFGYSFSASCGSFSTSSVALVDVTNLSVTIQLTDLRPVLLQLVPENPANNSFIIPPPTGHSAYLSFVQDGTAISEEEIVFATSQVIRLPMRYSTSLLPAAPGQYTFKVQAKVSNGATTFSIARYKLLVLQYGN